MEDAVLSARYRLEVASPSDSFLEPNGLDVKNLTKEGDSNDAQEHAARVNARSSSLIRGSLVDVPDADAIETFFKLAGWSSSDGKIQSPAGAARPSPMSARPGVSTAQSGSANFATWAKRSPTNPKQNNHTAAAAAAAAVANPAPTKRRLHSGLLGLIRSRADFLRAGFALALFAVLLITVGVLCVTDPAGRGHPFGTFGPFVGVPMIVFGVVFIALTINANSYFPDFP